MIVRFLCCYTISFDCSPSCCGFDPVVPCLHCGYLLLDDSIKTYLFGKPEQNQETAGASRGTNKTISSKQSTVKACSNFLALVNKRQVTTNTAHRTQRAHAPVNKRQEAPHTARANVPSAAQGQGSTNHTPRVGRTGATLPTRRANSKSATPRPLLRARPGCIGDHGKPHTEPC